MKQIIVTYWYWEKPSRTKYTKLPHSAHLIIYFADITEQVLLTKVDDVHDMLDKHVNCVFKSKHVQEKAEMISEYMGFSIGQVLPMKNYTYEQTPRDDINVLALRNLMKMLNSCDDTLQHFVQGYYTKIQIYQRIPYLCDMNSLDKKSCL